MKDDKKETLTRPLHPMPPFVKRALTESGLMEAYRARPPYQQNDYIGWINKAVRNETKVKRLDQMLDELRGAKLYMGMPWKKSGGEKQ